MPGPGAWLARVLGVSERAGLGLLFLLTIASIWVAASFIVQDIQDQGVHPVVLTYIANSLFAVFLPFHYAKAWLCRATTKTTLAVHKSHLSNSVQEYDDAGVNEEEVGLVRDAAPRSPRPGEAVGAGASEPRLAATDVAPPAALPFASTLRAALVVAPLWFVAQLTFNASLELTSVTSNTLLSSTSVLFTYLLSVLQLHERFTLEKLGCIALLIGGSTAVTAADVLASGSRSGAEDTSWGNALCLLSAMVYGVYTVAIGRMLGDDERASVPLFFGCMGAAIFVGVGAALCLALLFGAVLGTLGRANFGIVVLKGLLDNVLSDYLWARAILLVGPTIATAGLALQVPIAVVADAIFKAPPWISAPLPLALTVGGGVAILAGFLFMTLRPGKGRAREDHGNAQTLHDAEMTPDPSGISTNQGP